MWWREGTRCEDGDTWGEAELYYALMTTQREGSEGTGLSAVPSFHCQTVNQANKVTIKRADSHPAGYLAALSIYFLSKQDTKSCYKTLPPPKQCKDVAFVTCPKIQSRNSFPTTSMCQLICICFANSAKIMSTGKITCSQKLTWKTTKTQF